MKWFYNKANVKLQPPKFAIKEALSTTTVRWIWQKKVNNQVVVSQNIKCLTPQKLGKDETQQQFCFWIIMNTDAPTTVYQVPSLWWLVFFKTQWTLCNRRIRWDFPVERKKPLVGSKWWSKFTFPRNPCDLKHYNMYITDIFRVIPQMDHHDHFRMTIQVPRSPCAGMAAPQGEGVRGDVEQWGDGRSTVWSWCWSLDLWKITSRIEDPWRSFNLIFLRGMFSCS